MALDSNIVRRIRNLIPDVDPIFGADSDSYLFDDQSIEDFYTDGNNSVKWAAGLAKIAVGSSEALILKVIKNYETATDGASLAKQWLAMGQNLIEQAKDEATASEFDYFEIITDEDSVRPEGLTYGFPGWRV